MKTERLGDTLVVELAGEFDLVTAEEFKREVDRILASDAGIRNLVLDLGAVDFIDSSGLGAILGRYRRLQKNQGKLVAVGLSPRIQRVFETAGLTKLIRTYESKSQAIARL